MSEKIKITTATVSINEETDKIFVLFIAGGDNEFILAELYNKSFNKRLGVELGSLTPNLDKETGKFKNIITDLIKSTMDSGQILEYVQLKDKSYLIISLKFLEIEKIIEFNHDFLDCYDRTKMVFLFFMPTDIIEEEIVTKVVEKFFADKKMSFLDIIKFIGIKSFLIILILPIIIHYLVPPAMILETIKSVGLPVPTFLIKKY